MFEACLEKAGDDLQTVGDDVTQVSPPADARRVRQGDDPWLPMAAAISRRATARSGEPHALLLLLRSSGDPAAERLRLAKLARFAEKLAAAAGWSPDSDDDSALLRAQILLATAVGIAMLCAADGLQPLASASLERIVGPVGDVVRAMLGSPAEE